MCVCVWVMGGEFPPVPPLEAEPPSGDQLERPCLQLDPVADRLGACDYVAVCRALP